MPFFGLLINSASATDQYDVSDVDKPSVFIHNVLFTFCMGDFISGLDLGFFCVCVYTKCQPSA